MDRILSSMALTPRIFNSDGGSEFSVKPGGPLYNILVEKFHLLIYVGKGEKKGAIVERFVIKKFRYEIL